MPAPTRLRPVSLPSLAASDVTKLGREILAATTQPLPAHAKRSSCVGQPAGSQQAAFPFRSPYRLGRAASRAPSRKSCGNSHISRAPYVTSMWKNLMLTNSTPLVNHPPHRDFLAVACVPTATDDICFCHSWRTSRRPRLDHPLRSYRRLTRVAYIALQKGHVVGA